MDHVSTQHRNTAGHAQRTRRAAPGFSLIEILVVLAIIALLIGILLPALTKAKERVNYLVGSGEIPYDGLIAAFGGCGQSTSDVGAAAAVGVDDSVTPPGAENRNGVACVEDEEMGYVWYFPTPEAHFFWGDGGPAQVLDRGVSVGFWAKPGNWGSATFVFQATTDKTQDRKIGGHLAWGSTVYWDAGFDCCSDRVNKGASSAVGTTWNHWMFTKDADEGSMTIYLNGEVWAHEASGNYQSMKGADRMAIGSMSAQFGGTGWVGHMTEFVMYDRAVTEEEVRKIFQARAGLVMEYQGTLQNKMKDVGKGMRNTR